MWANPTVFHREKSIEKIIKKRYIDKNYWL